GFAWETTPELGRRHVIEGGVRAVELGDLDGAGRPELIVADERLLTVYRWQDNSGPLPAGVELRTSGLVLSIDAANLNGTGRAQLVLVEYRGEGPPIAPTVLEPGGERFKPSHQT